MLSHDIALLWSAITRWAEAINIWPRCGQDNSDRHYYWAAVRTLQPTDSKSSLHIQNLAGHACEFACPAR